MADQNDSNDDLVGLPDFHDRNEDAPVDTSDWRSILNQHIKEALGKTHSFGLLHDHDAPRYAFKATDFYPTKADIDRVMAEISAMPETVVVFEDDEITPEFYDRLKAKGGTSYEEVFKAIGREPLHTVFITDTDVETPRQHNERRYPDLMRRLDRLANRRDDDETS